MFKIQLENGEFYKSKSGRIQHYKSIEKSDAKLLKLGEIATGAKSVECSTKTKNAKSVKAVVKTEKSKKAKKSKKSTA
jgi:hypothetical protein